MALEHIEKRAGRIRERRDELRLTQEQVAERMQDLYAEKNPGAKPDQTRGQMVSDWERAVNSPTPAKLALLADALETTVADLGAGPVAERDVPTETPDVLGAKKDAAQLDRIEQLLERVLLILGQPTQVDLSRSTAQALQVQLAKLGPQREAAGHTRDAEDASPEETPAPGVERPGSASATGG